MKSRLSRTGFTLIELLTVIAIIIIMTVLAVPAFRHLGRANALSNAGNHLADLVAVARQNSMTKNTLTALIIARGGSGADGWDAAVLYELKPKSDGSAPADTDWKPLSKWENFPAGITVDETNFVSGLQSGGLPAPFPDIQRHGVPVTSYSFVAFMPRGALYPKTLPASNPYVRLVEGLRAGEDITYTGAMNGDQPANNYRVIIMASTGLVKVTRASQG